jgi:hypothetical protein
MTEEIIFNLEYRNICLKNQNQKLKKENEKLKLKIQHLTTFINRELRGFKSNHNKQIEEINKLENYEAMIDSIVSIQYDLDSDSD